MRALMLFLVLLSAPLMAQHPDHRVPDDPQEIEPGERGFPKGYAPAPPMEVTEGIKKYATDHTDGDPQKNFGVQPIHDNQIFAFLFVDRLEQQLKGKDDTALWDILGRAGNNFHRVFIESEGEYGTEKGEFKESRHELLYGYAIAPFWDLQGGIRHDFIPKKADRNFAVLSVQGLAPFQFETDAALYLSSEGNLSGIVELEYTFLLTQRTQLIPRLEFEASLQEVKKYNIGRGINGFEAGLRLSHQFTREFAPYVGVSVERFTGGTRRLRDREGESTGAGVALVGLRLII